MGQKRHRNKERNERKANERRDRVDVQNQNHNSALYADAFMESQQQGVTEDARIALRDSYPEGEDWKYTTLNVARSAQRYEKVSPSHIFIRILEVVNEDESLGYTAVLYANKADGDNNYTTIAKSIRAFPTIRAASMAMCRETPTVALDNMDGTFVYPYYDDSKGRVMARANERRDRRRRKAVESLSLLIGLGSRI